jgi:RecA-family ATPase
MSPWDSGLYEDETPEERVDRWEKTHPPNRPNGKAPIISLQSGAQLDAPTSALEPFPWIDMSAWDDEPAPERKWAIKDRVPLNQAGLFSGEGGTGKSIIELMKNVAHVSGKDWLGSMPEPGPAFYLGAEDEKDELHRRLAAIASHYGVTFGELIAGGLHIRCLLGEDATLCAVGKSGKVETTALYKQLYEAAGDIKPKNISIDTLSRAFAGNEIDRVQVYAFANHMQGLAMVAGGSVTVLSHPSLAGISSGSGISGSTAWHGAFRFRMYLTSIKPEAGEQPDGDIRALQFRKNQYGPMGEAIALRYQRGLFLPQQGMSSLDKLARQQAADESFLALLARYERDGRNVNDRPTANTYAPTAFSKEKEAKAVGMRKLDLEDAMRRLFEGGKIHVEHYGPPSHRHSRLKLGRKGLHDGED